MSLQSAVSLHKSEYNYAFTFENGAIQWFLRGSFFFLLEEEEAAATGTLILDKASEFSPKATFTSISYAGLV